MPVKLITPVTYEPRLSGFNAVFPVTLKDKIRQNISLPLLDASPSGSSGVSRGMPGRSTNQGALLQRG